MSDEVLLPDRFKSTALGNPHGMDYHLIDIKLRDGRCLFQLPLVHGAVIVGVKANGKEVTLNFSSVDITEIRRAHFGIKALFGCW